MSTSAPPPRQFPVLWPYQSRDVARLRAAGPESRVAQVGLHGRGAEEMIVDISDDLTVRIHDGTVSWSSSSRMTREAVDRAICTARIKAERRVAELRELQEAMVGARERRTEQDRREKP